MGNHVGHRAGGGIGGRRQECWRAALIFRQIFVRFSYVQVVRSFDGSGAVAFASNVRACLTSCLPPSLSVALHSHFEAMVAKLRVREGTNGYLTACAPHVISNAEQFPLWSERDHTSREEGSKQREHPDQAYPIVRRHL